jgi:catechol 2,3-dioxygenase-like lactoylglutathione lyase family enzyme
MDDHASSSVLAAGIVRWRRQIMKRETKPLQSLTQVRTAEELMKRIWTIIGVADVPRSFAWYQSLLGLPATAPAHDYFGQIVDTDGTVLLCLHEWGAHEHPSLTSPAAATPGNGLLLFFRVDDFDAALPRAGALANRLDEEPHLNPNTRTMEFSLRDPDGYYVTISALDPP